MLKQSICAALLFVLLLPGPCLAHKVILNAWIEDGELHAEVGFSDGSPAAGAVVSVFDPGTREELFSIQTDKEGLVATILPPEVYSGNNGLLVVSNAGAGHRAERLLAAEEIDGVPPAPDGEKTGDDATAKTPSPAGTSMEAATLETLVQQAVRKEIAPLLREIRSRKDDGPHFQDIVGGIGYILGLAGLVMLIKGGQTHRKRDNSGMPS